MRFELLAGLIEEGPLTVKVRGYCMGHALPNGARIRIQTRRCYLPGDIVTFQRSGGGLVSHRMLGYLPGSTGWRVITRADSATVADPPVPLSSVLGRVTAVESQGYRPTARERIAAFLAWPVAVGQCVARRLAG